MMMVMMMLMLMLMLMLMMVMMMIMMMMVVVVLVTMMILMMLLTLILDLCNLLLVLGLVRHLRLPRQHDLNKHDIIINDKNKNDSGNCTNIATTHMFRARCGCELV
jgi:hypothetical protein